MREICALSAAIAFFALLIVFPAQPSRAQSVQSEKVPPAENAPKDPPEISLKSYQEILEKERKLLDEQSERYYSRVDKLIERATWFFGVAIAVVTGLLGWTFLKARKEVQDGVKAKLEEAGVTQIQKQLKSVRDEYHRLKEELDAITSYKQRHIKWLYAAGCTVPDRSRLSAVGLQNISPVPIRDNDPIDLDADLVVISHEGDQDNYGKHLFDRVLDVFIEEKLQTPLVVYTPNNYKLNNEEFRRVCQTELGVPANTQATLVGYVQSLLRVGRVHSAL